MIMSKLKVEYQWRELTDDGLLKPPKAQGPYYDGVTLNGLWSTGTYESKEEAYEALINYSEGKRLCDGLVLVEIYNIDEDGA
jgi:hypothetical protein